MDMRRDQERYEISLPLLCETGTSPLCFQMVNHRLWRIEEMLTEQPNFVRINRSEIVNLDVIDGFEGNCYYIGKNPLYATGVYRQRMEGVVINAMQQ